jgi:Ni/Co efflux regulator RcnB
MKNLIVPAMSALLLAGMPAHAQVTDRQSVQIARNDSGGDQGQGGNNRSDQGGSRDRGSADSGGASGGQSQGDSGGSGRGSRDKGSADSGGTSGGDQSGRFNHIHNGSQNAGAMSAGGSQDRTGSRFDHRANRDQNNFSTSHGQNSSAAISAGDSQRSSSGRFNHRVRGSQTALGTRSGQTASTNFGQRPSNWNQYPRQFDRQTYQRNFTASRQFHWHNYNRPNGWYYQRWTYGEIFPRIFWAEDYWLTDYWMFDLPIPPYGYVWVRYGDDALLIDRYNGEVLEVEYGLFA